MLVRTYIAGLVALMACSAACGTVDAAVSVSVSAGDGTGNGALGVSPQSASASGRTVPTATVVPAAIATTGPGPASAATAPATTAGPAGPAAAANRSISSTVAGLLTFRGNATRSWYGEGPVPAAPQVRWTYPAAGALCGQSDDGTGPSTWCGTGWTGQPAVWERDGRTLMAFGAYDHRLHVLDAATGVPLVEPFVTGDLIKGSVSVDPDGYPLLYVGSRDDYFRIISFDGGELRELWKLWAYDVSPTMWNDDWDGSGLVVDGQLIEGGENGQLHVVELNRGYDADGQVTVAPELVFNTPGWDDELLADFGGSAVSIEGSVARWGEVVYFANSAGLVQGWDLGPLARGGTPTRTLRFWTGDDTDASVVIDDEGQLYVASEYEVGNERSRQVGQLVKLDPRRPHDPLVWSVPVHDDRPDGVWATPALHGDLVIAATNGGLVLGVDRATGRVRWRKELPGPTWQSPVVVDDVLVQGDCNGVLHGFDLRDPDVEPPELWRVELGGCIESTPAVWRGGIYVGTRAGRMYALRDAGA